MDQTFGNYPVNRDETARQKYLASQHAAAAGSRLNDNVTGKEVVTRSSKKPIVITPPLEATPNELYAAWASVHRRIAFWVAHKIAHATGAIDGIVDSLLNWASEIFEHGVFFISKSFHGAKNGWARGKYPIGQSQ